MLRTLCLLVLALSPLQLHAGFIPDIMIDPEDGMIDASRYLASARGFLPVPIIITEPAVGYGLGATVAYFHPPEKLDRAKHEHNPPPSISFGAGGYTENKTHFYGGGHFGVWKDDHVRYLGLLFKINLNAKYYGLNAGLVPDTLIDFRGVNFNLEGELLYQRVKFRLRESNWFLGTSYLFNDSRARFNIEADVAIPQIIRPELRDGFFRSAGAGVSLEYDGRNTIFTTTQGTHFEALYTDYGDTWGGDFDYGLFEARLRQYIPFGDFSHLGIRLESANLNGSAPFFAYPFVQLRGIPALRYEGKRVFTSELEYLWGFTPRWSMAFFAGAGRTIGAARDDLVNRTVFAGGVGVRYRLAKALGLQAGLDLAKGPEDTAVYLTMGSAW